MKQINGHYRQLKPIQIKFMEEDICNWIPKQISCVIVEGEKIPIDNVEILNVEEDLYGRDLISFVYNGETKQSLVVTKYI